MKNMIRILLALLIICALLPMQPANAELVGRKSGESDIAYYQRILPVGTRVLSLYLGGNATNPPLPTPGFASPLVNLTASHKYYYLGTITSAKIATEGLYKGRYLVYVQFDDGDKGWVPVQRGTISVYQPFSKLNLQERDAQYTKHVLARFDDRKKYWYLGTITQKGHNRYFVNYADGDVKWHTNMDSISALGP